MGQLIVSRSGVSLFLASPLVVLNYTVVLAVNSLTMAADEEKRHTADARTNVILRPRIASSLYCASRHSVDFHFSLDFCQPVAIPLLIAFHFVDFSTGSAVAAKFLALCKLLTPQLWRGRHRESGRKVLRS